MDSKKDTYMDLSSGSADGNGQNYSEYPPIKKQGGLRINAAISPKAFNRILIAVLAGGAVGVVLVVIKLIALLSLFF